MKKYISKNKSSFREMFVKDIHKNWILYVMILPVVIYFLVFHYYPMYGLVIAFKDYNIKKGILGSPWIGFDYFVRFFNSFRFKDLIVNTFTLSIYSLIVGFPIPIIFALFLNYLRIKPLKRAVQMVSYAPHFISLVVLCSMFSLFSTTDTAVFNQLRGFFGLEPVNFLAKPDWFYHIYVWTGVWQNTGWDAIIYLSALSGVDYELHDAAVMDGATKLQRMRHIDLPSIKPTIVMLLILRVGSLASVGFEKVFLLQNGINMNKASVISTYVYEVGLLDHNYGFSTAIGLFNTVINITLLLLVNTVSKKLFDESLF